MNNRFTILITFATLASFAMLLSTSVPLGIPGEWQWSRHAPIADLPGILDRLVLPLAGASLLIAVAVFARPIEGQSGPHRLRRIGSYSLLAITTWAWLYCVQQATPAFHRDVKSYWVLYSPSSSGYFFEAAFKIDSTSEFLAGYEDRMSEGEVLHIGTHPPGLFLLARGCLAACKASPGLVSLLGSIENAQSRETFRQLESEAGLSQSLSNQQLAALQLLALIGKLTLVLTIIPMALLAKMMFSPKVVWWICCLWPTLPCLAVFFPKSDVLFPLTTMMALALAVLAISGRRPILYAIAAGLMLWLGLMLSLAHIPVAAVLFCLAIVRAIDTRGKSLKPDTGTGLLIIFTIITCSAAFSMISKCNIASVWQWNLSNHAGFYEQFQRTWYKWLMVNPIELIMSVAVPVAAMGIAGLRCSVLKIGKDDSPDARLSRHVIWAMAFVMILLWTSGKNQGEAARLWCFMTPWLLIAAGHAISQFEDRQFGWLLTLQTISAIITVGIVNGFSF